MQIGFIGLGKMGSRITLKLLEEGNDVVVWNRSSAPLQELQFKIPGEKLKIADSIEDLVNKLKPPRIVWLMLTAGSATEAVLTDVSQYLSQSDILIDGGNSNYKDTEKRYRHFEKKGIRYLGIGVSGGVHAIQNGYPMMVGGDESAYEEITPILTSLGRPRGGHAYFGTGGAGHFVKMIHNGIEYGMMQAIGEGFGVLEKSTYNFDLLEVAKLFMKSTIVSGFLLDRSRDALEKDKKLSDIDGIIASSGEGEWTVETAHDEGVPIENIEQSVKFRERSQIDDAVSDSFAAKMVSALRHEFGGHSVKKK